MPWIAVAGLIALAVSMGIGRFAFTPLLPMMQDDRGLTVAAGGWLASVNYLGYLLGALTAAWLPLRPALIIRGGLVLIALATALMAPSASFGAWALWRLVAGVASAWVLVHVSAWAMEQLARRRRPRLFGAVFAGVGIGIALAGLLSLALMRAGAGSGAAWIALAAAALGLTALAWPAYGDGERATAAPAHPDMPPSVSPWRGEGLRLVLCYGAFGFGYIIPATFLPAMAKAIVPDPAVFGWSWPVFGLAATCSTLAGAWLQRFFSQRRMWIATHVVMAAGVAAPALLPGIGAILAAALLVGSTFTITTMVALQQGRAIAGGRATGLIAAMTTVFAAGQILGPIAAALTLRAGGTLGSVLLAAAAALLASAWALGRGRRRLASDRLSAADEA